MTIGFGIHSKISVSNYCS